jgi:hypothetical protein
MTHKLSCYFRHMYFNKLYVAGKPEAVHLLPLHLSVQTSVFNLFEFIITLFFQTFTITF